jgi:cytochrome P450
MVVLAAVAWPAVGPTVEPAFRRAFPALARRITALLIAHVGALTIACAFAPSWLLRGGAVVGLGVIAAVHWHSAVARGRRRGWPMGSLQPLALGPWCRQDFFLDQYRKYGSPFKTSQFLRPMACVVGLADGVDLFREHDASLVSPPWAFGRFIPGGFLRHMPRERHAAAKEVFRRAIERDVYEPCEAFIRDEFRDEFARMAAASGVEGVPPRRHIQRVVFGIWMRLFFDIAPATAECARLKTLYKIIDIRNPSGASDSQIRDALAEIVRIVRPSQRKDPPTPGAPRSFLEAMAASRPESADDQTMIGNLVYVMHTTWADVSGLLQWVLRMLTDHPGWADRLRLSPATAGAGGDGTPPLATRIVMETLRLEQSEYLYRETTRDIEHKGVVIPSGWLVRLCIRESHLDPTVFANPGMFDPDRFLSRSFTRREYAPFGAGLRHACVGEHLTRTVAGLFAEELVRGYRWRTVADGPPEHSAWRHWRPSSAWRIVMTPDGGEVTDSQQV